MKGLADLTLAIRLALLTGRLTNRKPVSLLIDAPPEHGKNTLVEEFRATAGVDWWTDATAYGLADWLFNAAVDRRNGHRQMKRYETIHHLIIPDLNVPLGRRHSAEQFIDFLLPLTYEGQDKCVTSRMRYKLPRPVTIGVIAGITPGVLARHRKEWERNGFIRRFLPLSYSYTEATAEDVFTSVEQRLPKEERSLQGEATERFEVASLPMVNRTLRPVAKRIVETLNLTEDKLHGFTFEEHLISLAMAHALGEGRHTVHVEDAKAVANLLPFMNYSCREV